MPTKIAINGFGRIGQLTLKRILDKHPNLQVVGVNDLRDKNSLLKDFSNDPIYGQYNKKVEARFFTEKDPSKLPWKELEVDIVLECTGLFRDKQGAEKHLKAGAKKVIISASSKSETIPTFVLGVNTEKSHQNENIISMASCTTNAVCPVAKVLDKHFGIKNGFINTIHSYTVSQNKVYPNWQKQKSVDLSIIPATTGATKSVEKCLPQLKGKLNGQALRVPTPTVSIVDFTIKTNKQTTANEVNEALKQASQTKELKGILKVEEKQLISKDYIGNTYSSIVPANLTQTFGDLVKVLIWYDNEYGYACRLAEFTELISKS
ncbi:MAG: type I glyceraldehyde-3-phosphate dehydrogenase [Parcubacteria group bacterium]|nr:type I glyceraldehyde-3-phosphate dehydrogenase [Parcubacteria group bacterium]